MLTKNPVSVTITTQNLSFVQEEAKNKRKTKSEIIDAALDLYRKFKLKQDLVEGFSKQTNEDANEAMSDFADYFKIIDEK